MTAGGMRFRLCVTRFKSDQQSAPFRVEAAQAGAGANLRCAARKFLFQKRPELLGCRFVAAVIDPDGSSGIALIFHFPDDQPQGFGLSPALMQRLQRPLAAGLAHHADAQYPCQFCHQRRDTAIPGRLFMDSRQKIKRVRFI